MNNIVRFFILLSILWININPLLAQTLVKNKSFLAVLKNRYPQLIVNDSFLSSEAANIKRLDVGNCVLNNFLLQTSLIRISGEVDLQAFSSLDTLSVCVHNIESLINIPASVKHINCANNKLKKLDIANIKQLVNLDCSYNSLENLIFDPKKRYWFLEFNCSYNQLKKLDLSMIEDISKLDISYNPMIEFPTIKRCNKLNCSGINLNKIAKLQNLSALNLTNLYCIDCQLNTLPPLSRYLTFLDCSYNQLTQLPNKLPNELMYLNCNNNLLTSLPENLPSNIFTLNCSNNQLTQLPEYLPWELVDLDCSYNQIERLPELLPKKIFNLSCNHNKISSLPEVLPLNLHYLYCNNNAIKEILYLPCRLMTINADSNLIHTIGDLPTTVNNLSFQSNPILDSNNLISKGWFKNANNQWDKPRKEYNCGLNYAIKMNCDSCVKGYQLTAAAQSLTELDLTNLNELLGYNASENFNTVDLSMLLNLKVLNAKNMNSYTQKLILPPQVQYVNISKNSNLTTVEGWTNKLFYVNATHRNSIKYPDSLKCLALEANFSYTKIKSEDTIQQIPKHLKYFKAVSGLIISDSLQFPISLEYLEIERHLNNLFAQKLYNLKSLKVNLDIKELPIEFKEFSKLKTFSCYCPNLTNLDNLAPNLDSLTIEKANLNSVKSLYMSDNLHFLQLKDSHLPNLELIQGKNISYLNLSYNHLTAWPVFNTPVLTHLTIAYNRLVKPATQLPATVKMLNIEGNQFNEKDWLKLPCSYWQQFEEVYIDIDNKKFRRKIRCAKNTRFDLD